MNKDELEEFFRHANELSLCAATRDDIWDAIFMYARDNGINEEELEIEY